MKGMHFLVIESREGKDALVAQGVVQGQVGQQHYACQFIQAGVPYTQVLSLQRMESMTLFANGEMLAAFVKQNFPEAIRETGVPKDSDKQKQGKGAQSKGAGNKVASLNNHRPGHHPNEAAAPSGEEESVDESVAEGDMPQEGGEERGS